MGSATRSVPRFLPTLTEVVHAPMPVVVADEPTRPVIDPQAILERVRTDLDLALQTHLEASVTQAMLEQVSVIAARIREEIEPMVRQAVADAVAAELDSTRNG